MENDETKLEALANTVALLSGQLCSAGRYDLLYRALGAPVLEECVSRPPVRSLADS